MVIPPSACFQSLVGQYLSSMWRWIVRYGKAALTSASFLSFLIGIVRGVIKGPLGTEATNGLLCKPRVIMMMEELVEWLARETEVLGRKSAPVSLCPPQTPHAARTRTRAAAVGSQRATNRLSYCTAILPLTLETFIEHCLGRYCHP
jgi:hypothetical protein